MQNHDRTENKVLLQREGAFKVKSRGAVLEDVVAIAEFKVAFGRQNAIASTDLASRTAVRRLRKRKLSVKRSGNKLSSKSIRASRNIELYKTQGPPGMVIVSMIPPLVSAACILTRLSTIVLDSWSLSPPYSEAESNRSCNCSSLGHSASLYYSPDQPDLMHCVARAPGSYG